MSAAREAEGNPSFSQARFSYSRIKSATISLTTGQGPLRIRASAFQPIKVQEVELLLQHFQWLEIGYTGGRGCSLEERTLSCIDEMSSLIAKWQEMQRLIVNCPNGKRERGREGERERIIAVIRY